MFVAGGMATAGVLSAGWPVAPAIAVGLGVGILCGTTNGLLINYARIPPFITTLGML